MNTDQQEITLNGTTVVPTSDVCKGMFMGSPEAPTMIGI